MRRFLPFFFIFAQLVLVSSAQKCVQNTDKLINGMCYRLVSQQLTYSDARDWCHSHNSFLAYVPQKTTATFLATYARASFDGQFNFWIGLNRRNSSSPFKWDAGYPVVFTNFQQITSQNCVVESVTNTLWSTYECDSELDFICSYEPGTTTPLETTTSAATVSEASTEVSTEASTEVSTSTQGSTKASSPLTTTVSYSQCKIGHRLGVFAYVYSTDFSEKTYESLRNTLYACLAKRFYDGDYVLARIDTDRAEDPIRPPNLPKFLQVFNENAPNKSISADSSEPSSMIPMLKKILKPSGLQQNAVYLFSMTRLPAADEDLAPEEYERLTYLPAQLFIVIYKSALEQDDGERRIGVLNRIAAVSNGHLIVLNDPDLSDDYRTYYIDTVSQIMNFCYNGNLMFTRNLGSAQPTIHNDLGTLMVPTSDSSSVNVYISVSIAYKSANSLKPANFSIDFHSSGRTETVICGENHHGSNFYVGFISIPADEYYNVTLKFGVEGEEVEEEAVLIRMWTDTVTDYQATFLGSRDDCRYPCYPNELNGAELYFQLRCFGGEGRMIITDCNGEVSSKYDARVTIPYEYVLYTNTSSPTYWFPPFFCDHRPSEPTCAPGAESKYDVQFVAGRFTYVRSFLCRVGVGKMNCTQVDENGNRYCTRDTLPFKRGPLGQLVDCLGRGFLAHNWASNGFFCVCDPGFAGVSCEIEL